MEESYGTYVDDEYFDNHDYDDTDDDTNDDTDDDNDHKKYSHTTAGAAPDAGAHQNIFCWGGRFRKTAAPDLFFWSSEPLPILVFLGGAIFNLP